MNRPSFIARLHPPTLPARETRFSATLGLGGISLLLYLLLIVTGIPLTAAYTPTAAAASESIRAITFILPYGWLLRNLHYWTAVLLLLSGALHLLRVVLTGGYKPPRRLNWLLGLAALLLSLLLSFSGYVLRWDVDTVGALTVAANTIRQTPLLGGWFYGLLVGGPDIADATLVRFHTWHTLGLSLPVLFLLGWHVFRARRNGGWATRQSAAAAQPPDVRLMWREWRQRAGVAVLALLCLLMGLALWLDAPLAPAVDGVNILVTAVTPIIITPWFLVWIQALLRHLPPLLAGIVIPLALLALLALLPWTLDRTQTGVGVWFNREGRWAQVVVLFLFSALVSLTLWEWWR
ncbi:MAG: cytochrome b N-terminal domain-containing protein [Chloroflexi bacterium]|nr:cytochrome b N-terminal domain-containing protein [Chloroflexota bacterium]